MDPELARPAARPDRLESGEPSGAGAAEIVPEPEEPATPPEPVNPLLGAREALIAIVISALVILGLWLLARDAPSAGTDPRLAPTATAATGAVAVGTQARDSESFANQVFVTAAPQPSPPPAEAPAAEAGER